MEHSGHRISKSISLVENMIRNSHEYNNTSITNNKIIRKDFDKLVENGEVRFSNIRKNDGLKNGVSHFNDSHFRNIRDEFQINNNTINNTNTPSLRHGSEAIVRNSIEEFDHYDKSIKRKKIGNISEEIVTMKNLAEKNNNNHNTNHDNDNNHNTHSNHNNHNSNHANTIHNNNHNNNINHNDNDYSNNLFSDINGNKNNMIKHNNNNINNTDHNHNIHNNHNHNNNHVFNKHYVATKQVAENHQNINHGQNNEYSVLPVKENRDILNQRINNRGEANYNFVGSYNNSNNSGSSSTSSSNSNVSNTIINNSNVNSLNNGNIIANRLVVNNNNKFNNNNNINVNNNNINNGNNNNMIHRNNNVNNILRGTIIDNNNNIINQNNNNVNNNVNNMYTNRPDNTPTTTHPYTVLPFTTSSSATSSSTTTSFSTSSTTTTITTEADIYYVIAEQKPIKSIRSIHATPNADNTTSGIPAFDQFKNLVRLLHTFIYYIMLSRYFVWFKFTLSLIVYIFRYSQYVFACYFVVLTIYGLQFFLYKSIDFHLPDHFINRKHFTLLLGLIIIFNF